jgi:hypothetical protein
MSAAFRLPENQSPSILRYAITTPFYQGLLCYQNQLSSPLAQILNGTKQRYSNIANTATRQKD